jgi:hypothetical protein
MLTAMPDSGDPRWRRSEALDRADQDGERGDGDHHDLEQRGQRLGLAMAEAVISSAGCAAQWTPPSVTSDANRSSAESARLASIATDPVCHAACLERCRAAMRCTRWRARRGGRGWSLPDAHGQITHG